MSTLNEFISQIKIGGLQTPSKYEVYIGKPAVIANAKYQNNTEWRKMLLFCDQATLPGITYTTTQSRTFGEFREMPYERIFDPLQLSFYCDSKMWIKGFFDEWLNSIQNGKTRVFDYYNRYTTDIQVATLDNASNITYAINLYECYPKSVSAIQLDYGAKDVMKLQVTMQYRYWKNVDYAKSGSAQSVSAVTPKESPRPPNVIIPQVTANISPSSQARLSSESEYIREMRARGLDPADPDGTLRLGIRGNTF
jgi:hypothetical protein